MIIVKINKNKFNAIVRCTYSHSEYIKYNKVYKFINNKLIFEDGSFDYSRTLSEFNEFYSSKIKEVKTNRKKVKKVNLIPKFYRIKNGFMIIWLGNEWIIQI